MNYPDYRNPKNAAAIARYWNKSLDCSDWYKIENKVDNESEILIFDIIGYPFVDAKNFVEDLNKIVADTITLRINSPGGDVWDGLTIASSLRNHPARVITRIEGLAASIASIIALAGDEVQINSGAMEMIHLPYLLTVGNEFELRDTADVLRKVGRNLLDLYRDKTGLPENKIAEMMKSETWLTASECMELGFVDTVLDGSKEAVKNKFDLSMYNNTPANFHKEKPKNKKLTKREIEKALRDAGASRSFALSVASGFSDTSDDDYRDDNDLTEAIAIDLLIKKLSN